jgi:hypothetical protein
MSGSTVAAGGAAPSNQFRAVFENREAALQLASDMRTAFDDGGATFSQLFFAYYAKNPARTDDPAERTILSDAMAYLLGELWTQFERDNGKIRDQYWCSEIRAAVVYTLRDPKRGEGAGFHTTVNWRPTDQAVVKQTIVLDELELATRFLPEGVTRTRSVKLVYDAFSSALGAMDHAPGSVTPEQQAAELDVVKEQVSLARRFFQSAGARYAQSVYLRGMLLSFLPMLALISVAGTFFWALGMSSADVPTRTAGWMLGGSIGAMLSVLVRITREDFKLNWEATREELLTAGAIRPIVGGVLGAAVPMLIIGGLAAVTAELSAADDAKSRFADLALALAAGFSERWAPDLIAKQPTVLGARDAT